MEPDTSLSHIDNSPTTAVENDAQHESAASASAFAAAAAWQPADTTTHLHPGNLPLARVQRAWERKPSSPLSRRRIRVGKVWKRVIKPSGLGTTIASETLMRLGGGLGAKRMRSSRASSLSPLRAVKKLRVGGGEVGEGIQVVSRWEGRESPGRKIVTKSTVGCGLVALPDLDAEEAVGGDGGVVYEVVGEDGRAVDLGEETVEAERGWLDVEEDEGGEVSGDATMRVGDAVLQARCVEDADGSGPSDETMCLQAINSENTSEEPDDGRTEIRITASPKVLRSALPTEVPPKLIPGAQGGALPDGFVSPLKRRKLGPRASRTVSESRRKTLPVQFAPAVLAATSVEALVAEVAVDPVEVEAALTTESMISQLQSSEDLDAGLAVIIQEPVASLRDDGWEDVEEEAQELEAARVVPLHQMSDEQVEPSAQVLNAPQGLLPGGHANARADVEPLRQLGIAGSDSSSSDAVPSTETSQVQPSLRRSPRRMSSSPLKQRTAVSLPDKPHHIAFTPLRRFSPFVDLRNVTARTSNDTSDELMKDAHDTLQPTVSPFQRASSAPPEEPQMSPRKPAKPRISDDTALLQAFLNRAAESKSTRRLSATEKESLSNRRDSDTVRQALASPAKPEVLMDLDPNSPSPRKQQAGLAVDDSVEHSVTLASNTSGASDAGQDPIEDPSESASGVRTRRSGRGRRKPQVYSQSNPSTASSAPSKINIRGLANIGDLMKKAETQELAQLTRNNTRKNKGGSVLPKPRLVKLALDGIATAATDSTSDAVNGADAVAGDEEMLDVAADGKRRIRWAETLVSFYQGSTDLEASQLSDEMEERMPWERGADFDPTEEPKQELGTPVPAAETPSKPKAKLRTLKASRTASTPAKKASASDSAKVASTVEANEVAPAPISEVYAKPKPAPKPRRSRIATPAKGLANASLLPADVAPVSASSAPEPTAERKKAAPTRKRAATSRLLPPGTLAAGVSMAPAPARDTSTTINGGGKENLTIASPPKKRSTTGTSAPCSAMTSSVAPKLDFGKAMTELKPSTSTTTGLEVSENAGVPSLASPAKKAGGRRAAILGSSALSSASVEGSREGGGLPVLGLSSPAKKRWGRRAGG
ncbi:hypothetical protein B0A55_05371 [Friedmanniomyces simplex]|uniref:Uncharacterized protein n=1 Tax=Friedmanniomyces simplex TaxID=329884 RepID=A0A4U0XJW6_9PEZI|nr:hypothetical protein B0A55_05371 [Friedmanniomyces simplex]